MIGAVQLDAIGKRGKHARDHAIEPGTDQIGPELVADPDPVADALDAFGVEIGTVR